MRDGKGLRAEMLKAARHVCEGGGVAHNRLACPKENV